MQYKFWGVRGSIPSPAKNTSKYGGNTSCLEIRSNNDDLIIVDAGTGIRKLGILLSNEKGLVNAHVLISHAHWDHIEGIPFFKPLYNKQNTIQFCGSFNEKRTTKSVLQHALHAPYFPVSLNDLKADMQFIDITPDGFEIGGMRIEVLPVNHPCHTVAFKFIENNSRLVYMTDNELFQPNPVVTPYETMVNFCKDADVLIHDAMYTQDEWNIFKGWGHSSIPNALHLAMDAGVRGIILFHHDPERTDKQEDILVKECRNTLRKMKKNIECIAAQEDLSLSL